jgi:hypothetical protein
MWDPRPDFCYCQTVEELLIRGALSDERTGLSFTSAASPRQHSHSRVRVPHDSWPYFTVSDSRIPPPGGQAPVFMSPRNRVAQLYPQAPGSLFITFYDLQGYRGGILTCLHMGFYSHLVNKLQFLHDISVPHFSIMLPEWTPPPPNSSQAK